MERATLRRSHGSGVLDIVPDAVSLGADGYLRVDYEHLGLTLITWDQWLQKATERLDTHIKLSNTVVEF